eukprot:6048139-Heterocapsa_arctica.AAC.1
MTSAFTLSSPCQQGGTPEDLLAEAGIAKRHLPSWATTHLCTERDHRAEPPTTAPYAPDGGARRAATGLKS